jgi:hypothetical protein
MIETHDGQVQVFEGSRGDMADIRRRLKALDTGMSPYITLVNKEGRAVLVYRGSVRRTR